MIRVMLTWFTVLLLLAANHGSSYAQSTVVEVKMITDVLADRCLVAVNADTHEILDHYPEIDAS